MGEYFFIICSRMFSIFLIFIIYLISKTLYKNQHYLIETEYDDKIMKKYLLGIKPTKEKIAQPMKTYGKRSKKKNDYSDVGTQDQKLLECPDGQCLRTFAEGNTSCTKMISWTGKPDFKNCHGKCVWLDEKCDGKCADNQCEDKDGSCREAGKDELSIRKSCHGKCLMSYLKCDKKCEAFQCEDPKQGCQAIVPAYQTGFVQWGTCKGKCTKALGDFQTESCDGKCEELPGFILKKSGKVSCSYKNIKSAAEN